MTRDEYMQSDIAILNDEFNDSSSFQNWKTHHELEGWPAFIKKADINSTTPGHFYIEPQTTGWYGEFHRGPFFYKEVTGDFTVSTRLKVTGKHTASPTRGYSLAGLMVRSSRPASVDKSAKGYENWMFLSTGSANKKGTAQFESKNTVKGKSKLKIFPAKTGWIEIAIVRVGNIFMQLYKFETGGWYLLKKERRPEMPDTLQIGLLAYTDFWPLFPWFLFGCREKFNTKEVHGKPDLVAMFDYIHFTRPEDALAENFKTGFCNTALDKELMSRLRLDE